MKTERRIFQNVYLDSVTLMRISANLMKLEGVAEASVLMGTPSNMDSSGPKRSAGRTAHGQIQ